MTDAKFRCRLLSLLLLLTACNPVKTLDGIGEYMPVIGDRCEHWQCITASGKAQSDAIKADQKRMESLQRGQVPPAQPQQPATQTTYQQYQPYQAPEQGQYQDPNQAAAPANAPPPSAAPRQKLSPRGPNDPPWGNDPYDTYRP